MRGVRLTEAEQGLIKYTCLTYTKQPQATRDKIDNLVEECGGEYKEALKEVLCTYKSIRLIAQDHFVSEMTLYYKRKAFYEKW